MGEMTLRPEDAAKLREYVAEKGMPVEFEEFTDFEKRYPEYAPDRREKVSTYGWRDFDATYHCTKTPKGKYSSDLYGNCHWIVPEGAVLYEITYSQFAGTGAGNDQEVGINVEGCYCACGKYTDMTLRITESFSDIMAMLLDVPKYREYTL